MEGQRDFFERMRLILPGRQLIVVSNREPYSHRRGKGGALVVDRAVGGLVAALDPIMQELSGTWIAWGDGEADFEVTDPMGRVRVPPEAPRYALKRIPLTRPEIEGFYYGYANQALWPLCHMAMEYARFRARPWATYQAVNHRFAEAVEAEADPEAVVWLHDYHLALCPRYLRRSRPELFLMQFWHIPWPAWDIFRICPHGADLLDGLLANDLIAFQHPRHVEHFLECAARVLGAQADDNAVEYGGRLIDVKAFPISVDVATLEETARSLRCERWMARLRRRFNLEGRLVVVSVDRLDYTKGIPERLQAIDLFFRRRPEYRSRVVFIQKTAPSRTRIKAYRDLQERVERDIERLNGVFGTDGWRPVISLPTPLPPVGMAALYRMADLCVVSSLQDGMNLVAKEFVACQIDRRGALALSELTGARDELSWAIPINPYDPERCADALARGLEMPDDERRRRMDHLRAYLGEHDIFRWTLQHVETAAYLIANRPTPGALLEAVEEIRPRVAGARPVALLADFDGTLVGFADEPDAVVLPDQIRTRLARMARSGRARIGIVSGRALDDIRLRVGIDELVYAGNHGLEIAGPGWTWTHPEAARSCEAVAACCRRVRQRLRGVPGAWVEDKGLTASVHYRGTPHRLVERVHVAVLEDVAQLPSGTLVVHPGKHALEIRPDVAWGKGDAVRWILTSFFGVAWPWEASIVYAGDDRTDEDAFEALADHAVTVKVGPASYPTAARYSLRDIDEVYRFIQLIDAWITVPDATARMEERSRNRRARVTA
ncbi:MAG TPA: bifunctional alpha,alpha-trehalose-phosphate synthase (UDP-forming)/trehalose-phosphatase [bacterium]|nr:bifunctional alpha,alpha-trehalose-phosphate synthase (UDP-forming)/trehalose-phosphatase [bacterium]